MSVLALPQPRPAPALRRPVLALLDARALVALCRVKGELVQLLAGELVAQAAVLLALALAAGFDGAGLAPEGLLDLQAALAFHDLTIFALAALKSATGFYHKLSPPDLFYHIHKHMLTE